MTPKWRTFDTRIVDSPLFVVQEANDVFLINTQYSGVLCVSNSCKESEPIPNSNILRDFKTMCSFK